MLTRATHFTAGTLLAAAAPFTVHAVQQACDLAVLVILGGALAIVAQAAQVLA